MHLLEVLRRPIITEKSTLLQEQGRYLFEVALGANKPQVKEAVELAFQVKVRAVNIMRVRGEMKRRGMHKGLSKTWKKAVVTLQPGQKIQIFEGA